MTISPSDLRPTAPTTPVESAGHAAVQGGGGAPQQTDRAVAAPAGDRLDLSDAARTQTPMAPSGEALETARIALQSGGEMSDARLHDLRERVRTGYYDQPEVIGRIAEAAARDLTGTSATS